MILLEILVAGNVMVGPDMCEADIIYNDQVYTVEYKCQENGILRLENPGIQ
jgi:hypothetical protein